MRVWQEHAQVRKQENARYRSLFRLPFCSFKHLSPFCFCKYRILYTIFI